MSRMNELSIAIDELRNAAAALNSVPASSASPARKPLRQLQTAATAKTAKNKTS